MSLFSNDPGLIAKAGSKQAEHHGHLLPLCMDTEGGKDFWSEVQASGREQSGENQQ